MAFSNAPTNDSYSSQKVQLINTLDTVSTGSGWNATVVGMQNVLPFKKNDEIFGETREMLVTTAVGAGGTGQVRGMYVWEKSVGTLYYFMVIDQKIYTSTNTTVWTNVTTLLTAATTPVRFCEFIDATNTKKLVLVDGVEGYVFTSNAAGTKITDVDFPTPHVPFPVFLDGYLFLAKAGTGDIYNSDLNDPAVWTAGSYLSSELYPDDIQALVKVNNYILAIGTAGSEFFYDAANATASPLARYEGGSLPFGTICPNSIAANQDTVVFLANTNDGQSSFKVIEGFKHASLENQGYIVRSFEVHLGYIFGGGSATMAGVRGFFMRQNGSLFYCFNEGGTYTSDSIQISCYAYSFDTKMWVMLGYNGTSNFCYPVFFTAPATSNNMTNWVAGTSNGNAFFGYTDPNRASDSMFGGSYLTTQKIQTPPTTFGTANIKTMSRISLIAEVAADGAVTLNWADNPGSWSNAAFLSSQTQGLGGPTDWRYPYITQLGAFRRRTFLINFSSSRGRWGYLECDINKGQQ